MVKKYIILTILLFLLIVFGVFTYYQTFIINKLHPSTALPNGWYICPPDDYFHLKDKNKNEVVQWLQSMPYRKSMMGLLEESPYTYDEWIDRGMHIENLEDTLLSLYESKYHSLINDGLLEAFYHYGTQKSLVYFQEKIIKSRLSIEEKKEIYQIMRLIIKDYIIFSTMIEEIEEEQKIEDQYDPNIFIFK